MRTLHTLSHLALGLITAAAITQAQAQDAAPAPHDPWYARYQADLADCARLGTAEAIADCRREAGAAYQTARKGELRDANTAQMHENALQRCQSLPADQREECLSTMRQGSSTQTYGSVSGGGILRRTEITIPAEPAPSPGQPAPLTPRGAAPELGDLPRTGKVLP